MARIQVESAGVVTERSGPENASALGLTKLRYSRCKICGGKIHEWPTAPGRWFHDTVSTDDKPFDIFIWLADDSDQHVGIPA